MEKSCVIDCSACVVEKTSITNWDTRILFITDLDMLLNLSEISTNLDYLRVEANPPNPNIKVDKVAHDAVVNYREWATTKPL